MEYKLCIYTAYFIIKCLNNIMYVGLTERERETERDRERERERERERDVCAVKIM